MGNTTEQKITTTTTITSTTTQQLYGADGAGDGESPGCTALMYACQQGDVTQVEKLLKINPMLAYDKDRTLKIALHYCADTRTAQCADMVYRAAPDLINAADEDGLTPLHLAVIAGNIPLTNFLLANNVDVNAVDNEKHSVVHWATVCGERAALRAVLLANAPVSTPDVHGGFPLHYAAQMCGTKDTISSSTNSTAHKKTNANATTDNRVQSAERDTSKLGLEILDTLLTFPGIRINVEDIDGRQPLLWAASAGSSAAVLALVAAGSAPEAADKDGLTALHCAASRGHADCLEALLTMCGVAPDIIDTNGCTALHYAVTLGHADCTALLLAHGAKVNRQDRRGRTPAHCGCAKGQVETVRMLGAHNADLWVRSARGDLPLHEACSAGRKQLVRWLLSQRPSQINAANNNGRTPLHFAVLNDNTDVCKILLDHGANVNSVMRTAKNILMTPLDCALRNGHRSTAKFLQLNGGLPFQRLRIPTSVDGGINVQLQNDITVQRMEQVPVNSDSEGEIFDGKQFYVKSHKRHTYKHRRKVKNIDKGKSQVHYEGPKTKKKSIMVTNEFDLSSPSSSSPSSSTTVKVHPLRRVKTKTKESQTDERFIIIPILNSEVLMQQQSNIHKYEATIKNGGENSSMMDSSSKIVDNKFSIIDLRSLTDSNFSDTNSLDRIKITEVLVHANQDGSGMNENRISTNESDTKNKTEIVSEIEQEVVKAPMESLNIDESNKNELNTELTSIVNSEEKVLQIQHATADSESKSEVIKLEDELPETMGDDKPLLNSETNAMNMTEDNKEDVDMPKENEEGIIVDKIEVENREEGVGTNNLISEEATMNQEKEIENKEDNLESDNILNLPEKTDDGTMNSTEIDESKNQIAIKEQPSNDDDELEKKPYNTEETESNLEVKHEDITESTTDQTAIKEQRSIDDDELEKNVHYEEDTKSNMEEKHEAITELTKESFEEEPTKQESNETEEQCLTTDTTAITTIEKQDEENGKTESDMTQQIIKNVSELDLEQNDDDKHEEIVNTLVEQLNVQATKDEIKKEVEETVDSMIIDKSINKNLGDDNGESDKSFKSFQVLPDNAIKKIQNGREEVENVITESVTSIHSSKKQIEKSKQITKENERTLKGDKLQNKSNSITTSKRKTDGLLSNHFKQKVKKDSKTLTKYSSKNIDDDEITLKTRDNDDNEGIDQYSSFDSDKTDKEELFTEQQNKLKIKHQSIESTFSDESDMDQETYKRNEARKRRAKTRSKSAGKESYNSDGQMLDSGFEPSPRNSRIPRKNCNTKPQINMTTVTQTVQGNIRRYHLERKIFQHLLELKRLQIRSGQSNEAVLVKRAIDEYHRSILMTVGAGRYKKTDYTFKGFEKFLYDSLRKIQTGYTPAHLEKLPETASPPLLCTHTTMQCDHAAHAYTGIPCAAYITKLNHHTIPKVGFGVRPGGFLPRLGSNKDPHTNKILSKGSVTLELTHGVDKQFVTLPADRLDQNKKYFVTFTVKGLANAETNLNNDTTSSHRHAKSC